jgi:hypothetical protein
VSVERFLGEVIGFLGVGWYLDNLSEVSDGGIVRNNVKPVGSVWIYFAFASASSSGSHFFAGSPSKLGFLIEKPGE